MFGYVKDSSVTIGDTDMCYISFGKGKKTFVVIPGLSDGLATVKGKGFIISRSYKAYFKDYTVYMFSRKNKMPEGYSIKDMADDLATALHSLGIERTCVMGVSQGGMIAQYLAIRHPELVEKLVLTVTAPCANDLIRANVSHWIELAERGEHKSLMIDTAEKGYSENYLKKYRKFYPIIGFVGKQKSYDRFLKNAHAILGFDASGEVEKISCPVFVIGGSIDGTVGIQGSYDLHEKIKGSELYVYEGISHAPFEEAAADFYNRVLSFLRRE